LRSQSLPEIALAIRQRVDLSGQQNAYGSNSAGEITDSELQFIIWAKTARLWALIVETFGENYYFNTYFLATAPGTYAYQLPFDHWKTLKVGIQYGSGSNLFWNILPYNIHEQDHWNILPGFLAPVSGWTTLRYQVQGQQIVFQPQTGALPGTIRIQYVPTAPFLVPNLPTAWASATPYVQGSLVTFSVTLAGVPTVQTFIALNAGTSGGSAPAWNVPGTVVDNGITWAYKGPSVLFQTTFDGINGWEDLLICEAAIDCAIKTETSQVQDLQAQRADLVARMEVEAANRQAGDPPTITGGWGMREGGGFGGAWGDMEGY
jgi:hypothetical protein